MLKKAQIAAAGERAREAGRKVEQMKSLVSTERTP